MFAGKKQGTVASFGADRLNDAVLRLHIDNTPLFLLISWVVKIFI